MDVEVLYGGDEVPKSPFRVDVAPELNVNKVKVVGLPEGICEKHSMFLGVFQTWVSHDLR